MEQNEHHDFHSFQGRASSDFQPLTDVEALDFLAFELFLQLRRLPTLEKRLGFISKVHFEGKLRSAGQVIAIDFAYDSMLFLAQELYGNALECLDSAIVLCQVNQLPKLAIGCLLERSGVHLHMRDGGSAQQDLLDVLSSLAEGRNQSVFSRLREALAAHTVSPDLLDQARDALHAYYSDPELPWKSKVWTEPAARAA